jgi:SAM-dependent methyltransferase
LKFPDAMFDAVFSVSVFEHVSDVVRSLAEIRRVLRIGGCALISFEPVWSCSYGHHLHHFAECADVVPPWGHLIWSPAQMRDYLSREWPLKAPLSLDEAIDWVYYGDSINRINIRQFKELFDNCGLTVSWRVDLKDDRKRYDPVLVQKGCEATGLDRDELMTKGLCMLLSKGTPKG